MITDWSKVDIYKDPIRVVFYGRVSTDHEEQLDAFDNQILWYEGILKDHPNWKLARPIMTYTDPGVSGTRAETRPGFMQMIEDANKDIYDMIVTREVSRFARNIVDCLSYARQLKALNIQIYFVSDKILTISDNGEMWLGIFSTFAQSESEKISKRVKHGMKIARENSERDNKVIFGNGNILGYRRKNPEEENVPAFIIEPEQAETVRKIFEWYVAGNGLQKIKQLLRQHGYKTAEGNIEWHTSTLSKILSNPMYIGKQYLHQTETTDMFMHTRRKIPKEEQVIIQGDFEPIIDEELFYEVQRIKESRKPKNKNSTYGGNGRKPQDKWVEKLECDCGSHYKRYVWHNNKRGDSPAGYSCRNKSENGSTKYLEKRGIDPNSYKHCDAPSIPEWHLELMARYIFSFIVGSNPEEIIKTFEFIEKNYQEEENTDIPLINKLKKDLEGIQKKIRKLLDLFMDDIIDKATYEEKKSEYTSEIERITQEISKYEDVLNGKAKKSIKEDDMLNLLQTLIDMYDVRNNLDPEFIRNYIDKVVVRGKNTFEWLINLGGDAVRYNRDVDILPCAALSEKREFTSEQIKNCYNEAFRFNITFTDAHKYCKSCDRYLRSNQWQDKVIIVYIRY